MSWPPDTENSKELIVGLLQGNIQVFEDDTVTPVIGVAHGAWYDKDLFQTHGWQVSVGGPGTETSSRVMDIGAYHKEYVQTIPVNVWVHVKRGEGIEYTPERLRTSLEREIERIIYTSIIDPGVGIKNINCTTWRDIDEPALKLIRSEMTVEVEWEWPKP